jgi:hypothetical protein
MRSIIDTLKLELACLFIVFSAITYDSIRAHFASRQAPRCRYITQGVTTMQTHTTPMPLSQTAVPSTDDRLVLLEEVDFKWLMAGHGWWIDTSRLHNDPAYAAHLFDLVEADTTPSAALKDCAALLRAQVGTRH